MFGFGEEIMIVAINKQGQACVFTTTEHNISHDGVAPTIFASNMKRKRPKKIDKAIEAMRDFVV